MRIEQDSIYCIDGQKSSVLNLEMRPIESGKSRDKTLLWKYIIVICCLLFSFFYLHGLAQAQLGLPQETDRYINDFADIILPNDEARIRSLLIDLEERSDVEGTVVTIESIYDYGVDYSDIETFAASLFDSWGIGQASTNDGVLLLVALEDRTLRIELGHQYRGEYDYAMERIINEVIIPQFREDQYSQGIVDGMEATIDRIVLPRERAKQNRENTFPTPAFAPSTQDELTTSSSSGGVPWLWIFLGIGAVGAVAFFGSNYYRIRQRTRPRNCPNCDELMMMLDEEEDDMYLDSGQKAEEYLKSVDYDVWLCPNCDLHNVYPHPARFTRYSQCPTCSYITVDKYDNVLQRPTVYSTGEKQIVADCQHCTYNRTETVVIPRVRKQVSVPRGGSSHRTSSSRPSFSSSSSRTFGGGRSGGGGASGSW
ncbi:MAG: TPM domain-containing protein [Chloroflexota bacterium]